MNKLSKSLIVSGSLFIGLAIIRIFIFISSLLTQIDWVIYLVMFMIGVVLIMIGEGVVELQNKFENNKKPDKKILNSKTEDAVEKTNTEKEKKEKTTSEENTKPDIKNNEEAEQTKTDEIKTERISAANDKSNEEPKEKVESAENNDIVEVEIIDNSVQTEKPSKPKNKKKENELMYEFHPERAKMLMIISDWSEWDKEPDDLPKAKSVCEKLIKHIDKYFNDPENQKYGKEEKLYMNNQKHILNGSKMLDEGKINGAMYELSEAVKNNLNKFLPPTDSELQSIYILCLSIINRIDIVNATNVWDE